MELEWDEEKRQKNLRERGIDFALASLMEPEGMVIVRDTRIDYGEPRFISMGLINGRLHILCWTPRDERMRVISLRKANEREQKTYSQLAGPPPAPH